MPIVNKLVQNVGAGIGLVSESISASKAKKRDANNADTTQHQERGIIPSDHNESSDRARQDPDQDHELQWDLDEAQDELRGIASPTTHEPVDDVAMAELFARQYPPPDYDEATRSPPRLPYPVVLPQRRPKARARGFVRAYAPVLEDFGINEAMFLDFLDKCNTACMGANWLNVLNLASIPTMLLPEAISVAVSIAIQLVTRAAIEVDGRRRSNNFIDAINRDFFRPRGLFCLLMTWNPEIDDPFVQVDIKNTISKAMTGGGSGLGKIKHKLKAANADSYGNQMFPEVAPLVFPVVDRLATDEETKKKNKTFKETAKRRKEFAANYFDKRAQAKFIAKNPDSALNQGPQPTFTSRYADPNHPASSGSPIALLTGGYVTRENVLRMTGRGALADQTRNGRLARGSVLTGPMENRRQGPIGTLIGGIANRGSASVPRGLSPVEHGQNSMSEREQYGRESRRASRDHKTGPLTGIGPVGMVQKMFKQKVIYLMIVNMPSEEELQQAREALG
ncbi:hypothetical protein ASPWEDRAFT_72249, partial [Aspergillus wentii DTO 134E9]